MSLLIGLVLPDRVVLMADSLTHTSGLRNTVAPKIDRVGKFAVAHCGSTKDWYLYRSLITDDSPLTDPFFHIATMKRLREIAADREKGDEEADLALLIAAGPSTLCYADHTGQIYKHGTLGCAGMSWPQVERCFIEEPAPVPSLPLEQVVDWGFRTAQRIQRVDRTIEVPPLHWMDTISLTLERRES